VNNSSDIYWLGLATVGPVLLVILIARKALGSSPRHVLWFALCGAATSFFAMLLERLVAPWAFVGALEQAGALQLAFFVIAPVEEIAKYAIIHHEITTHATSDGHRSAIVGMAVGGGFAAFENAIYLLNTTSAWSDLSIARLSTATPFHLANGVIAGILAWYASRTRRPLATIGAVLTVIVLHGAYDAPLLMGGSQEAKYAFVLGLAVAVAVGAYRRLVKSKEPFGST
jgi:RsiW-degrading membrane proteinase PrsW (M82 family)